MGAYSFCSIATGATADEAFENAKNRARSEYRADHDGQEPQGYSGTILEKHDFVVLDAAGLREAVVSEIDGYIAFGATPPEALQRLATLRTFTDLDRLAVARWVSGANDKWGPAYCVEVAPENGRRRFAFFGMASS